MQPIIKRIIAVLSVIFIAVLYSCEKEEYVRSYTFEYSFETEEWPLALAGTKQENRIYVASEKSVHCYHESGVHQALVMHSNFNQGKNNYYYIRGLATDLDNNLYILTQNKDNPYSSFVLVFNKKHKFISELTFSERYNAIAQQDSFLYLGRSRRFEKYNLITEKREEFILPVWEHDFYTSLHYSMTDITVANNGVIYTTGMGEVAEHVTASILSSYNINTNKLTMDVVEGKTKTYVYGSPKANYPGICLADDGSVLLAAYYDKTFHIYDQSLNFIEKIGLNTEVPEIVLPTDILEQNGKVFVLEHFGNKVHVYRKRE